MQDKYTCEHCQISWPDDDDTCFICGNKATRLVDEERLVEQGAISERPLTPRQQRFVQEYLIDLNATQAAIRAGYSPESAKQEGSRLLTNADLRARIDIALAERSKRTGVNADIVIQELAKIARVNLIDVIDPDTGEIKVNSLDDLAAVAAVRVKLTPTKNGDMVEREVRLADKIKALELLGKHLGMFIDRKEITGKDGGPIQLEAMTAEQREQRIRELLDKRKE